MAGAMPREHYLLLRMPKNRATTAQEGEETDRPTSRLIWKVGEVPIPKKLSCKADFECLKIVPLRLKRAKIIWKVVPLQKRSVTMLILRA